MIQDCVDSIEQHIVDPILSRNIVSNTTINVDGYNLIHDIDFWKKLDPTVEYKNLYNHNWIKQQIFKLNVDAFVDGNVLIVDAEIKFTDDVRWVNGNSQKMFYTDYWNTSAKFIDQISGLIPDLTKSFVVETMIFSTDVLKHIRDLVEKTHHTTQLNAYGTVIFDDPFLLGSFPKEGVRMSEYDLYAIYMLKFYPNNVSLIEKTSKTSPFGSAMQQLTSNSENSQTRWLTFYEQVRGLDWPSCDNEKDFYDLPTWIQEECINVYGYSPK
jgi:hypothetical protein